MNTAMTDIPEDQGILRTKLEFQLSKILADCNEYLNRGDFTEALECLEAAVNIYPRNPDFLSHRGQLLWLLKKPAQALADFSNAVSIHAGHIVANIGLARCHIHAGAFSKAEACARHVLTLDPKNQEAAKILSEIEKIIISRSAHARKVIMDFYDNVRDEFAMVEPPNLSEWHLKKARVLPSRENILARMPQGGIAAEIGTQAGDFAKQILAFLKPKQLHIFDIDFTPFDRQAFDLFIRDGIVVLHEGDSSSALAQMPDHSLDFIYVDGDHSYEGVTKDLAVASQKIKSDGWIVCNDYTLYSPAEKIQYGVYRAVNELCWQRGFEIIYLGLHHWGYHDVALRRMDPESITSAGPSPSTRLVQRKPSPKTVHGRTQDSLATSGIRGVDNSLNENSVPPTQPPRLMGTSLEVESDSNPGFKILETIGPGDEMFTGDMAHYFNVGKSALFAIDTALTAVHQSRKNIHTILDLPCGHGRVMRHLRASFPHAELTACDLNKASVDFCAQAFNAKPIYSHLDMRRVLLPVGYDLIWSGSLLTHLRADSCAEFIRLFSSIVKPGGLIIFTMHGRWVERSLATRRYIYGLIEPQVVSILKEYEATGFGYADYPGKSGYGISISSPAFVLSQLAGLPDLKLVSYHEKGWDNHQDVICLQKQASHEPLS